MAGKITVSTINDDTGVLATQNGMTGIAKAWVNFNGSTVVINGSFNVSSVVRNATGDFTISFTTAMPSTTYSVGQSVNDSTFTVGTAAHALSPNTQLTTSVRCYTLGSASNLSNLAVQIFSS